MVIVIGLALFAFIAGDAWKIFQPHQNQRDAGVVDGEKISAQEFQDMVEEYTRVQELLTNNHISDDALTQIRDGVWQSYVTYKLIETEADKLGLTVTDDEIKQMLQDGTSPCSTAPRSSTRRPACSTKASWRLLPHKAIPNRCHSS